MTLKVRLILGDQLNAYHSWFNSHERAEAQLNKLALLLATNFFEHQLL